MQDLRSQKKRSLHVVNKHFFDERNAAGGHYGQTLIMQKHIKHTALFLLLVIVYPFLFQALHIIHHDHNHAAGHRHVVDQSNKSSCSSLTGFCSNNDGPSDDHHHYRANCDANLDHKDVLNIVSPAKTVHDHEECPLCEHEFAKFNLKRSMDIFFTEEIFTTVNTSFYQNPPVLYTGNHISLRAPPRLS